MHTTCMCSNKIQNCFCPHCKHKLIRFDTVMYGIEFRASMLWHLGDYTVHHWTNATMSTSIEMNRRWVKLAAKLHRKREKKNILRQWTWKLLRFNWSLRLYFLRFVSHSRINANGNSSCVALQFIFHFSLVGGCESTKQNAFDYVHGKQFAPRKCQLLTSCFIFHLTTDSGMPAADANKITMVQAKMAFEWINESTIHGAHK